MLYRMSMRFHKTIQNRFHFVLRLQYLHPIFLKIKTKLDPSCVERNINQIIRIYGFPNIPGMMNVLDLVLHTQLQPVMPLTKVSWK